MQRAGSQHSKTRRNTLSKHSVPVIQKTPQLGIPERTMAVMLRAMSSGGVAMTRQPGESDEEFIGRLDAEITVHQEQMRQREAARDAKEREGVTLAGKRLEQAQRTLDHINMAAHTVNRLAVMAVMNDEDAESCMMAAHNSAMLICRYADVLASLLGGTRFGNFEDEFVALTPERAAKLEQEEAVQ